MPPTTLESDLYEVKTLLATLSASDVPEKGEGA